MVLSIRETRETVQFTLRLPAALHNVLTREADGAGVTLTSLIIGRLARSQSEVEAERQLTVETRSLNETRQELTALRGEISELRATLAQLQPEHIMVRALKLALRSLSPSSGYLRSPRRRATLEAELEKTRDEVRHAIEVGLASMRGMTSFEIEQRAQAAILIEKKGEH